MKKNRFNPNNRIVFLLISLALVCVAIIGRLFYIQVIMSNEYTKMALTQITRSEDLVSDRGQIFDRSGKKLAIDVSASTIYVDPTYYEDNIISSNKTIREIVSDELAPLLQMESSEILEMIQTDRRVKIKQWVDRDIAIKIRDLNLDGVEVVDGYKRFYPFGTTASHLIGFTNIDNVGQYGVEASYDSELSGVPGKLLKSSDALNRQLPTGESEEFKADDGMSLVVTIDQSIQEIIDQEAQKIIEQFKAERVSIIVQETKTGDILGMSSMPSFNLNFPREAINESQKEAWKNMTEEEIMNDWYLNWRNPAIGEIYEPGSTFKLFTAAAAIEENTTNPNKHYYCTGYIRDINGAEPLRCVSYKNPHGDITLTEGLAKSCNPTFVYVNRELGREKFLKYINGFGFGERTGIKLNGEEVGIVPSSAENISEINFATMSYGHGIAVTPIQLINAVSALGNDGVLMTPNVVKELINSEGNVVSTTDVSEKRQVVSHETAETMLEMMQNVVDNGSGVNAKSSLYRIGGKTGTANKTLETGGYSDDAYISSFVGLAPIEDPKITVLIIVDSPKDVYYGSIVAAPSAKVIFEKVLNYLGVAPSVIDKPIEDNDLVRVPDLNHLLIGDAGEVLTSIGLKYTTEYVNITENTIVKGQKPNYGESVKPGTIIELQIDLNNREDVIIPKLIGKTQEDAEKILEKLGLGYLFKGEGLIIEQIPTYSETIEKNGVVEFILGDYEPEVTDELKPDNNLIDGVLE